MGSTQVPLWNVPYRRNPYFTGQEAILTQLHRTLNSQQTAALTQPQAISGLGGIGKTQIALEYAHRHREEYQAIFWCVADSRESLTLDYVALASLLNLPEKNAQDQTTTIEAVKYWLDTHSQWLLILDNADDLSIVNTFFPSSNKGHILLTTRSQAQGILAHGINVDEMELTEGMMLLLRRARVLSIDASINHASITDRTASEEIVQALGRLPLAIDQAGAYIEETGCGVPGYLKRYRSHYSALLRRRGKLAKEHPESVTTTWSLSFEKVKQINAPAADLLQFFAFLHPEAIPEELIIEGNAYLNSILQMLTSNPLALDEAIEALRSFSLVRRHPDTNTISIHRLVQVVLREALNKEQERQWAECAIRVVSHVFPSVEFVTRPLCERYILHVQTCISFIRQWKMSSPEAAHLLHQAGQYLTERIQYAEAEILLQDALKMYEEVLGPNHLEIAQCFNNLAMLFRWQGRYPEAESLFQRAYSIFEQSLGLQSFETSLSINNLAMLYQLQGKYPEAEPLYQLAFNIREQVLGKYNSYTATTVSNLAMLFREQGRYAEAEPLLQRALDIREHVLGAYHPELASSLNNLGTLYWSQGRYAEAEPLYYRALDIHEQVLEPNHPETAQTLNNLAMIYWSQGRYAEAEPLLRRALNIHEQVQGKNHPDLAVNINNLAQLYQSQGKYTEAEPLFQRALEIREQTLGPNHPDTAQSNNNLAVLRYLQGRYTEAEPLYQRALNFYEQILGPSHPDTAQTINNLAMLYGKLGKYEVAEPLLENVLNIREQVLGPEHPNTAQSLSNLAQIYLVQGKYTEAEPLFQRALNIYQHVVGENHPHTARILRNLAMLYQAQGKYAEAEPQLQHALEIYKQVIGADHPDTVQASEEYASLLQKMQQT